MKKPALVVIALLLLAFASIYFIIPQNIVTTNTIDIDATDMNVAKFLVNKKPWQKWWPGNYKQGDSSTYAYQGRHFMLTDNNNSEIQVNITDGNRQIRSRLMYLASGEMSCKVTWQTQLQSALNPFTRVSDYMAMKSLSGTLGGILSGFKKFMQTDTNIYGMAIKIETIKYASVLATTISTKDYPAPADIYKGIGLLKQHIKVAGAMQIDSPMMNAYAAENGYQTMIAIPIDKEIRPGANMVINNLVKGGNLLTTQVKGGKNTVINAFDQLKKYEKDHSLSSPAMPYEIPLTNRLAEPDSAKWVTKISWPIY